MRNVMASMSSSLCIVLISRLLYAADPPASPSAPPTSSASAPAAASPAEKGPPDVVTLNDGGMLRGTIIELVPKQHVRIMLPDGETRRVPMDRVSYAGPAAGRPSQAPASAPPPANRPLVSVRSPEAQLHLTAAEPNVTFYLRTGQAPFRAVGYSFGRHGGPTVVGGISVLYEPICTAPCDATMASGTYRLALSKDAGVPIAADEAVVLKAGTNELRGTYTSYQGTRTAGWIVLLGSVVAGTAVILTKLGAETQQRCIYTCREETTTYTHWAIGGGIMLVGGIVGAVLALKSDEAEIAKAS